MLTLILSHKWPLQKLNVNIVFLKRLLEEEVYLEQPQDFEIKDPTLFYNLTRNYMTLSKFQDNDLIV